MRGDSWWIPVLAVVGMLAILWSSTEMTARRVALEAKATYTAERLATAEAKPTSGRR